ncbi:MAG: hypothetical protein E6235_08715 [Anaerococcus vaginalis]|uniref:hypothetical protein n=1 Tax=Anaerococcus TaxID=165779 RepID=UPI0008A4AA62|nr:MULTISPECIES: hypothetical protein [Anaerococcus]HEO0007959.1 hypothetical protein [Streptococcus agalactiae]MDU5087097.1 hypothetical protein [Anaerococcus vaginalis]MDU5342712.1 hypothetical protein [Anaerococcus vaginalis]MDU5374269.1 hypothetical protein [Anaerococcus vaginalis]OFL17000.1 hypothetical protein HMPREF2782_06715 [Anaerococcus sp. HMSC068A02]
MDKTNLVPEKLKKLFGSEYNQSTQLGKEISNTNFVQRYDHLCLRKERSLMHQEDSLEKLINDIDKELIKTKLNNKEVYLELQKYRYIIAKDKNDGGFVGTNFPSIIKTIGAIILFIFSITDLNIIDTIKYSYCKIGLIWTALLYITILGIGGFLYKTFTSTIYEDKTNKYHDFLTSYLIINNSDSIGKSFIDDGK